MRNPGFPGHGQAREHSRRQETSRSASMRGSQGAMGTHEHECHGPVLHCALRTPQREAESRRVYARRCTGDITRGARALTMAPTGRSLPPSLPVFARRASRLRLALHNRTKWPSWTIVVAFRKSVLVQADSKSVKFDGPLLTVHRTPERSIEASLSKHLLSASPPRSAQCPSDRHQPTQPRARLRDSLLASPREQ